MTSAFPVCFFTLHLPDVACICMCLDSSWSSAIVVKAKYDVDYGNDIPAAIWLAPSYRLPFGWTSYFVSSENKKHLQKQAVKINTRPKICFEATNSDKYCKTDDLVWTRELVYIHWGFIEGSLPSSIVLLSLTVEFLLTSPQWSKTVFTAPHSTYCALLLIHELRCQRNLQYVLYYTRSISTLKRLQKWQQRRDLTQRLLRCLSCWAVVGTLAGNKNSNGNTVITIIIGITRQRVTMHNDCVLVRYHTLCACVC